MYRPDQFAHDVLVTTAEAVERDLPPAQLQANVAALVAKFLQPGEPVLKFDDEQQMVWGWASVAVEKGQPVHDLQGDVIDIGELQKAAHAFVVDERVSKEQHAGPQIGTVVDSIVFTKEVQHALGINLGREGWYVGVHVEDPRVWARVKKGELAAFSIGGSGEREPLAKEWSDAARKAAAEARRLKASGNTHAAVEQAHEASAAANGASNLRSQYPRSEKYHQDAMRAHRAAAAAHTETGNTEKAAFHNNVADSYKAQGAPGRADSQSYSGDLAQHLPHGTHVAITEGANAGKTGTLEHYKDTVSVIHDNQPGGDYTHGTIVKPGMYRAIKKEALSFSDVVKGYNPNRGEHGHFAAGAGGVSGQHEFARKTGQAFALADKPSEKQLLAHMEGSHPHTVRAALRGFHQQRAIDGSKSSQAYMEKDKARVESERKALVADAKARKADPSAYAANKTDQAKLSDSKAAHMEAFHAHSYARRFHTDQGNDGQAEHHAEQMDVHYNALRRKGVFKSFNDVLKAQEHGPDGKFVSGGGGGGHMNKYNAEVTEADQRLGAAKGTYAAQRAPGKGILDKAKASHKAAIQSADKGDFATARGHLDKVRAHLDRFHRVTKALSFSEVLKTWSPEARAAAAEARRRSKQAHEEDSSKSHMAAKAAHEKAAALHAKAGNTPDANYHRDMATEHHKSALNSRRASTPAEVESAVRAHRSLSTRLQQTVGSPHEIGAGHEAHSAAWNERVNGLDALERGDHVAALEHFNTGHAHMNRFDWTLHKALSFNEVIGKVAPPNDADAAAQLARESASPIPHAPGSDKQRADAIAAHGKAHIHLTTEQSLSLLTKRTKVPLSSDETDAHLKAHLAAGGKRDQKAVEEEEAAALKAKEKEQQSLGMAVDKTAPGAPVLAALESLLKTLAPAPVVAQPAPQQTFNITVAPPAPGVNKQVTFTRDKDGRPVGANVSETPTE